ncbi:MAG: hypothetical protein ACYDDN_09435, partial [Candidatus Desulforudaceae bacterium]
MLANIIQGALPTVRGLGAADVVAESNNESVVLVEKYQLLREILDKPGLQFIVGFRSGGKAQPAENAVGIAVNDKDRLPRGIQDYGIRSLLADAA